jgi:hypothetical protein
MKDERSEGADRMGERVGCLRTIRPANATIAGMSAILLIITVSTLGGPRDQGAPSGPGVAPVDSSSPELASHLRPGVKAADVWALPSLVGGPRDEAPLIYDNGEPVDDWGDPASQLSLSAIPEWHFIAGAADDFTLPAGTSADTNYRIQKIRAPFLMHNGGSGDETPDLWTGIDVTVYANSALDMPDGHPTITGGHSGTPVATQLVTWGWTYTTVGTCRPCFVVDIPVDFILAKNTLYWLSLVPRYIAPPQTLWCLSQSEGAELTAVQGSSFLTPFWNPVYGNRDRCPPDSPPERTKLNLSFQIYGQELTLDEGACCDTSTGACRYVQSPTDCAGAFEVFHPGQGCEFAGCQMAVGACCDDAGGVNNCTDNVEIASCQGPTLRFSAAETCVQLDPPCGEVGACCLPLQMCQDLAPAVCTSVGGIWHAGSCPPGPNPVLCPPDNDACDSAVVVTDGIHVFSTLGASTDGPPLVPHPAACADVNQDVWFNYTATCTGMLVISLCDASTDYDSAMAVYEGCTCMPSLGTQVACDDNGCGAAGGASEVSLSVTLGTCYLIRVGGVGTASGSGTMVLSCTPYQVGACCHENGTCDEQLQMQCTLPGDTFYVGQTCTTVTCPPPAVHDCCLGDSNGDWRIDGLDIQLFVEQVVNPPTIGTLAFCEADINGDLLIDVDDVELFVQKLLSAAGCPPPLDCCHGDTNGDGLLDGRDVQGLCNALIETPLTGSPAFCRADVNSDGAIDQLDVEALAQKLLSGEGCPIETGACCHADGTCAVTLQADCVGTWTAGGICDPNPCPQPTGSCCHADGTCAVTLQADCVGTWTAGGICDPNPCPQPTGPCCHADGTCAVTLQADCVGTWMAGGVCDPNPCPCPRLGDMNADGSVNGLDVQGFMDCILGAVADCRCGDFNADTVVDLRDLPDFCAALGVPLTP